jgi:squalene synthase HpnC
VRPVTRRENFPVGSVLIRRDLRGAVLAFYAFARAADDAADDPGLSPSARLARLDAFEAGLDGRPSGAPEGPALLAALRPLGREGAAGHARQLLRAFRRDAVGGDCRSWDDLLAYCEDSANPVGRFLLDLHGEGRAARAPADALCTALQVLNHLQDLRDDHLALDRRYLPLDWLAEEGLGPEALGAARAAPELRRAIARALERTDALLDRAAALPGRLASRRLAGESAAILRLARGLSAALRAGDPLAARIAPSRAAFARAGLAGLVAALRPRRAGAPRGRPA